MTVSIVAVLFNFLENKLPISGISLSNGIPPFDLISSSLISPPIINVCLSSISIFVSISLLSIEYSPSDVNGTNSEIVPFKDKFIIEPEIDDGVILSFIPAVNFFNVVVNPFIDAACN